MVSDINVVDSEKSLIFVVLILVLMEYGLGLDEAIDQFAGFVS